MQITIDLMDLLMTVLILAGVTLGVFLIIFLAHLIKTLKQFSHLAADLHDPLTQTAVQLPGMIQRVDGIAKDMSNLAKSANETVPEILKDAKTITGTARAGVEAVGSAAESVSSGVSSLFGSSGEQPGNFNAIIGIVGQIIQIVSQFAHWDKTRKQKSDTGFNRGKKRRR